MGIHCIWQHSQVHTSSRNEHRACIQAVFVLHLNFVDFYKKCNFIQSLWIINSIYVDADIAANWTNWRKSSKTSAPANSCYPSNSEHTRNAITPYQCHHKMIRSIHFILFVIQIEWYCSWYVFTLCSVNTQVRAEMYSLVGSCSFISSSREWKCNSTAEQQQQMHLFKWATGAYQSIYEIPFVYVLAIVLWWPSHLKL